MVRHSRLSLVADHLSGRGPDRERKNVARYRGYRLRPSPPPFYRPGLGPGSARGLTCALLDAWFEDLATFAQAVPKPLHARWDGNECFSKIRTHPSHNKRLNHSQFVRSKNAYLIYFQKDSVRSSFKSCVINVGCDSPQPCGTFLPVAANLPARPICDAEVRRQKVKLLIPGHIPGSFCEF